MTGIKQEAETETLGAHGEPVTELLTLLVEVALCCVAVGVDRACPPRIGGLPTGG